MRNPKEKCIVLTLYVMLLQLRKDDNKNHKKTFWFLNFYKIQQNRFLRLCYKLHTVMLVL